MKIFAKIFLILLFIFSLHITLYTLHSYAAVPHLINYQGRLTDSGGTPLNGSYQLTFRIYDAETAGNLLWEETHSGAVIQKGIFGVMLGSVTNLNLAFDKPYFLEIKVGSEVMSPRQRITSAGYAIRAETAEQAQNATTVANVGVTTTPTANKILPLDANAKISPVVFKTYDSGWFAISTNNGYTKTHNLGTTKVITQIYLAENSDGSGWAVSSECPSGSLPGSNESTAIASLSSTQIIMRTGQHVLSRFNKPDGSEFAPTSGYARIIMLALE